jgi:hypothetical protein
MLKIIALSLSALLLTSVSQAGATSILCSDSSGELIFNAAVSPTVEAYEPGFESTFDINVINYVPVENYTSFHARLIETQRYVALDNPFHFLQIIERGEKFDLIYSVDEQLPPEYFYNCDEVLALPGGITVN